MKAFPKTLQSGLFNATLFHKEQKRVTCSNCLLQGHHSSTCTSSVKCRQCFADGHKAGGISCTMTPTTPAGSGKQQQQEATARQEETPLTLPTITRSKYRLKRRSRSHNPTSTHQKGAHPPSADSSPRSAN